MDLSKFIGIPYKPKGRGWDGVDCLGLVILFHQELNGVLIQSGLDRYTDPSDMAHVSKEFDQEKRLFIPVQSPQLGDIITLRIGQFICHLGLWIDGSTFLHSLEGHDSAIERLDSHSWKHRIAGFYRPSNL